MHVALRIAGMTERGTVPCDVDKADTFSSWGVFLLDQDRTFVPEGTQVVVIECQPWTRSRLEQTQVVIVAELPEDIAKRAAVEQAEIEQRRAEAVARKRALEAELAELGEVAS